MDNVLHLSTFQDLCIWYIKTVCVALQNWVKSLVYKNNPTCTQAAFALNLPSGRQRDDTTPILLSSCKKMHLFAYIGNCIWSSENRLFVHMLIQWNWVAREFKFRSKPSPCKKILTTSWLFSDILTKFCMNNDWNSIRF